MAGSAGSKYGVVREELPVKPEEKESSDKQAESVKEVISRKASEYEEKNDGQH